MDIRIYFSLIVLTLLLSACPKDCEVGDYHFELGINYSPVKDTFQIGDTLHIVSEFNDQLFDSMLNMSRKVEDFSFFTAIVTRIIVDGEQIPPNFTDEQIANINVDYNLIDYSFNASGVLITKHNYENDTYKFSFDLILNKQGLYYMTCQSDIGQTINTSQQRLEDQCSSGKIYADYKANDGDAYENNFALVENTPPIENLLYFNFNRLGGFAFIVKE